MYICAGILLFVSPALTLLAFGIENFPSHISLGYGSLFVLTPPRSGKILNRSYNPSKSHLTIASLHISVPPTLHRNLLSENHTNPQTLLMQRMIYLLARLRNLSSLSLLSNEQLALPSHLRTGVYRMRSRHQSSTSHRL